MLKTIICFGLLLSATSFAFGEEPPADKPANTEATKATYLITGLHCPPCTRTVEAAVGGIKGVKSVKVDWRTKIAKVEFEEAIVPAQQLADLIAATPHMMGGEMVYDGWLALQVPDLKDEAATKTVLETLRKVAGVKQVAAYPAQKSVGIQFLRKGKATTKSLIDALEKAGFKASNF